MSTYTRTSISEYHNGDDSIVSLGVLYIAYRATPSMTNSIYS
jgi:hypothetical protein